MREAREEAYFKWKESMGDQVIFPYTVWKAACEWQAAQSAGEVEPLKGKPLLCPFCGKEPAWEPHEDPTYPQVECRNLECPIGLTNDTVSLESWNTRYSQPPTAQAQEAEPKQSITLSALQLREAAYWANPDLTADEDETEVCIAWMPKRTSTDGEEMEAGDYLYFVDCPEDGVIGPLGKHPVPDAVNIPSQPPKPAVPEDELKALLGVMCGWFETLAEKSGWTPENAGSAWAGYRKAKAAMLAAPQPPTD